jgi:recombinational DNA repair ATPase RecF
LIDDLPAELDADNRQRVMRVLAELEIQLFVTALEPGLLDAALWREARIVQLADGSTVATDLVSGNRAIM